MIVDSQIKKYRKWYYKIINNAKKQNRKKGNGFYYEEHHILPKSLFPLWRKRKSNKVLLTAREHFFCHQLLAKIYPSKEMWCALMFFLNNKRQGYKVIKGSREYEKIKQNYIDNVLKKMWTEEYKKESHIKSVIRYYGSYDVYKEKLEKENNIIRSKVINKIINQCRKKFNIRIEKEKNKEKREKRHFEIINEKEEFKQRKKDGMVKGYHKIICLNTLQIFINTKEAADILNIGVSGIFNVLSGYRKTYKGLFFEYYNKNKKYKQLKYVKYINPKIKKIKCIETGIIYDSANQVKKQLRIKSENILKVCKGKRKTAGGYHWIYYNENEK